MKRVTLSILAAAVLFMGCSKPESGGAPEPIKRAKLSPPSTSAAPATTSAAPAGGDIGIPECDSYLKNYETCVSTKVPEASRAALKTSLDTTRDSWKKLAADANSKAALTDACKKMTDTAKESMKAYGCTF